jgi:hypothetical protein
MNTRLLKLTKRDENGRRVFAFSHERLPVTATLTVSKKLGMDDLPVVYTLFNDGQWDGDTLHSARHGLRGVFQSYPHMLTALLENQGVVQ